MTDFDMHAARQRCADFMGWYRKPKGNRKAGYQWGSDGGPLRGYRHPDEDLNVCALVAAKLAEEHEIDLRLEPNHATPGWNSSGYPVPMVWAPTPALAWFMACDEAIREVTA